MNVNIMVQSSFAATVATQDGQGSITISVRTSVGASTTCATIGDPILGTGRHYVKVCSSPIEGKFVHLVQTRSSEMRLAEIEVYGKIVCKTWCFRSVLRTYCYRIQTNLAIRR